LTVNYCDVQNGIDSIYVTPLSTLNWELEILMTTHYLLEQVIIHFHFKPDHLALMQELQTFRVSICRKMILLEIPEYLAESLILELTNGRELR